MSFRIAYKSLAQQEVAEAYTWYSRPEINMGHAFLDDLQRIDGFVANNPYLYPQVEAEIRRANLSRFPYSIYFVVDDDVVSVLSCFHQHREPRSGEQLKSI